MRARVHAIHWRDSFPSRRTSHTHSLCTHLVRRYAQPRSVVSVTGRPASHGAVSRKADSYVQCPRLEECVVKLDDWVGTWLVNSNWIQVDKIVGKSYDYNIPKLGALLLLRQLQV